MLCEVGFFGLATQMTCRYVTFMG